MSRRSVAIVLAVCFALVGGALVIDRGGVLAWAGLLLGIALVAKLAAQPSRWNLAWVLGTASIWALAWAAVAAYVLSTWESGEVVELSLDTPNGTHSVRVWVLDAVDATICIYDADPEIAQALIAADSVRITRAGVVSVERVEAVPATELPQAEYDAIFQLMSEKYGSRNDATDVFYTFMGGHRDRVLMILKLQ